MSNRQLILFQNMCELLNGVYGKYGSTPTGTLNRRFLKSFEKRHWREEDMEIPPRLSEKNTTITIESWDKEDLWKLATRRGMEINPRNTNLPVIMVRYKEQNYLIHSMTGLFCGDAMRVPTHSAHVLTVHE